MARTRTHATDRLSLSIQQRVLDLADKEASLLGSERSSFLRLLLARAMGSVQLDRSTNAPPRDAFNAPKKEPEMARLELKVQPEQKQWLLDLSVKSGGVPISALLTLLILDWSGINPVAACFGAQRTANRPA